MNTNKLNRLTKITTKINHELLWTKKFEQNTIYLIPNSVFENTNSAINSCQDKTFPPKFPIPTLGATGLMSHPLIHAYFATYKAAAACAHHRLLHWICKMHENCISVSSCQYSLKSHYCITGLITYFIENTQIHAGMPQNIGNSSIPLIPIVIWVGTTDTLIISVCCFKICGTDVSWSVNTTTHTDNYRKLTYSCDYR